jgi:hypothetical protein
LGRDFLILLRELGGEPHGLPAKRERALRRGQVGDQGGARGVAVRLDGGSGKRGVCRGDVDGSAFANLQASQLSPEVARVGLFDADGAAGRDAPGAGRQLGVFGGYGRVCVAIYRQFIVNGRRY